MVRLLKYMKRREWVLVLLALALIVLQVSLDLALPDYMEEITELVETAGSDMSEILHVGGKMLLAALGSLAGAVLTVLLASSAASTFCATLRERMFDRVESFSGAEFDRFTTPTLINRTTSDVLQVQMSLVLVLEVVIKAPIKVIWAIVKISADSMQWAWIAAIGGGVLLALTVLCIGVCYPKFRRMQQYADDVNRITRDNLHGLHSIRASGGELFEERRFEAANERLTGTHLFTAHTMSILSPTMQLSSNLLTIAIYFVGALLINAAAVSARVEIFSETVAFVSYMMQILSAFLLFATATTLLPRAMVSAKRINEVLDVSLSVREGSVTESPVEHVGELTFSHVTFRYPDAHEDVLRDVTFSARRGEDVAIIGAIHSGKSAVTHLLLRHYDPSAGEIGVSGVALRDYNEDTLHQKIAYVGHEPFLFDATVRENIAFGDGGKRVISDEKLEKLVRIACAEEMMRELPNGADTHVVEGGVNLSAGEAQRIAIMRALCKEPEILILDDAFSAFDISAVQALQRSINEYCADLTILIIARRISAVRDADKIVVLENGAVVGMGTHEDLLCECDVYRRIADAQRLEVTANV